MDSILQQEKECYFTGAKSNLHEHHVFPGRNRGMSEKYGLKIWLRADLHTGRNGIHFNREMSEAVKRAAQRKAMKVYGWSKDDFIQLFGRNYL